MLFGTNYISDDEYLKNIPKETKKFIENCAKYTSKIISSQAVPFYRENNRIDEYVVIGTIYALIEYDKSFEDIFRRYDFKINKYQEKSENKPDNIYEHLHVIDYDLCNNTILSPLDVASHVISLYGSNKIFKNYVGEYFDYSKLENALKNVAKTQKTLKINELKEKYFCNMLEPTKNFLSMAATLYSVLYKTSDLKIIDYNETNIKSLSLFLSLMCFGEKDNNEYHIVVNDYLKRNNLDFITLANKINFTVPYSTSATPVLVLNKYFKEYSGSNESISSIIKDVFIEDKNSVARIIFNKFNINFDVLNSIYMMLDFIDDSKSLLTLDEYNSYLNPNIIEYLENSYKIHEYLYNIDTIFDGTIIQTKTDIKILSMFLELLNSDNELSRFMKVKNITTDSICKLLNIELKDDYKNIEIDENNLVRGFYRYIPKINTSVEFEDKNKIEFPNDYSSITINHFIELISNYTNINSRIINRIYYRITNSILPSNWSEYMKVEINKIRKISDDKFVEEYFKDYDTSIYDYLTQASSIYMSIQDKISNEDERAVISLLLSANNLTNYKSNIIRKYLKTLGFDEDILLSFYGIKNYNLHNKFNSLVIKNHFDKYVSCFIRKDIVTVEAIVKNLLEKDIYFSFNIQRLLEKMNMSYYSFKYFITNCEKYENRLFYEEVNEAINKLKKSGIGLYDCIMEAFITNLRIQYCDTFYNSILYLDNDLDRVYVSLLLSLLSTNNIYTNIFNENGITYDSIKNKIALDTAFKMDNLKDRINDINMYKTYNSFIKYLNSDKSLCNKEKKDSFNGHKKDLGYIARRLFDDNLKDNKIIKKLLGPRAYNHILGTLYSEKNNTFSTYEIINELSIQTKPFKEINTKDMDSILEFILEGDKGLSKYSEYILLQVKEISDALNIEKSLESMDSLADNIYTDTPVKQSLIARIFSKEVDRKVNNNVLNDLNKEIDTQIDSLKVQIKKYREIFKVISIYLEAVDNYKSFTSNILDEVEIDNKKLLEENDFSKKLSYEQIISGLTDKINGYDRTITLMKNQQLQIASTIINHLITRNALQTSKDDIIPIISSGILFSLGNKTNKNALELSNSLVGLFKNVIEQDVVGAKENLKVLKTSNLSQDTVDKIVSDFDSFVKEIESNKNDLLELPCDEEENVKVKKIVKRK